MALFRKVCDDKFHRVENSHYTWCSFIEFFAKAKFQQAEINEIISFCNTDLITKKPDAGCGKSSSSESGNCWHPWIIPATYMSFIYQLQQLAFTHNRIGHIEPGKFILVRRKNIQVFNEPVIEW